MAQALNRLTIFFVLALAIPAFGQVQVKSVRDFSGGIVNGVANAFVPDNGAVSLSNYDVVGGVLDRRPGLGYLWADTGAPYVGAIFPWSHYRDKSLFAVRQIDGAFESDTISENTQQLVKYGPSTHDFELVKARLFDGPWRNLTVPQTTDRTQIYHRLFIAESNSELVYMTDSSAAPARPLTAGQPRATTLAGGGALSGRFVYKYAYIDTETDDTSVFSAPSFPVYVDNGQVALIMDTGILSSQDSIGIIRRELPDLLYYEVATISSSISYYIDNTPTASLSLAHAGSRYGWHTRNTEGGSYSQGHYTRIRPPGGFGTNIVTGGSTSILFGLPGDSAKFCWVAYVLVYVDSLGRRSYSTAMEADSLNMTGAIVNSYLRRVTIDSFPPLPQSGISEIELWRRLAGEFYDTTGGDNCSDSISPRWYRIHTFTQSGYDSIVDGGSWEDATHIDTTNHDVCIPDCVGEQWFYIKTPEQRCPDDSVIVFQPSIIEHHADRLWAAGNPELPDYLYYSNTNYPTLFPPDQFVRIASQDGDGITGLLSIADVDYYDSALPADQLVVFKKNSVWAISGFTFSDYRLSQLMSGVGLVAERGYCKDNFGVYFVGNDGVYQLGKPQPLSAAIQETVDSASQYISRSVLRSVGDELWWSLAIGDTVNNRTLVYSLRPSPHWTSYNFAMRDAIAYDTAQDWTAYSTDRSLILTETDTVFRWNYADADTLDGTTKIQASYQSKFFFDDPVREKVLWVDLFGTGTVDSLRLLFYENDGDQVDTAYIKPVFTDQDRDRVAVNLICENFSLRIEDFKGVGNYRITGYDIGYMVWDDGKK
jgi:hypothetical protein